EKTGCQCARFRVWPGVPPVVSSSCTQDLLGVVLFLIERTVIVIGAVDSGENPSSRRSAGIFCAQGVCLVRGRRDLSCGCRTVPPNCWPILGSDRSVSSRHRYMAMCRAVTSTRDLDVPHRSSMERPK